MVQRDFKSSLRNILRIKKMPSAGDIDDYNPLRGGGSMRSSSSGDSQRTARTSNSLPTSRRYDLLVTARNNFVNQYDSDIGVVDPNTTETYVGEWKNDLRCGFGEKTE